MKVDPNFYENLLDDLYDGLYFTDTNRKITFWNKGAEKITGYKSDEVVGSHCGDNILMHVNDQGVETLSPSLTEPLKNSTLLMKPSGSETIASNIISLFS